MFLREPWHWLIVILAAVLLFGAKRLPDSARSLGQSLRIFKSEIKKTDEKPEDPEKNPEQMSPTDARMPLLDHLRELRKRITFSVLAIIVFGVMGWFLYVPTIDFLAKPLCDLSSSASINSCDVLYINGVLGPLNLQIKVALMIGIVQIGRAHV